MRTAFRFFLLIAIFGLASCARENSHYHAPASRGCSALAIEHQYMVKWRGERLPRRYDLNARDLELLLRQPALEWAEPNYNFRGRELPQARDFNSTADARFVHADSAWRRGAYGKGILVAVVDSGVDTTQPQLAGAIQGSWNFITDDENVRDETGHGTHVAGIIAARPTAQSPFTGLAPEAGILAADFMESERGSEHDALRAIQYSLDHGARIINNSWSEFCSFALAESFGQWQKANAIFVNAAGNQGVSVDGSGLVPSSLELFNTLSVGSVGLEGKRSTFSNYGQAVPVFAPGEEIASLSVDDSLGTTLIARSGTSMSAAFVSGALALAWSAHLELDAAGLLKAFRATSDRTRHDGISVLDITALLNELDKSQPAAAAYVPKDRARWRRPRVKSGRH